jgi:hypothetical protein
MTTKGGKANLVVICIIPCPYAPGKNPRTPLVTHLLDGKYLGTLGFTFNQLSHFLNIESLVTRTPLVRLTRTYPRRERATRGC